MAGRLQRRVAVQAQGAERELAVVRRDPALLGQRGQGGAAISRSQTPCWSAPRAGRGPSRRGKSWSSASNSWSLPLSRSIWRTGAGAISISAVLASPWTRPPKAAPPSSTIITEGSQPAYQLSVPHHQGTGRLHQRSRAKGLKVKIYYTVREDLSNYVAEMWACGAWVPRSS